MGTLSRSTLPTGPPQLGSRKVKTDPTHTSYHLDEHGQLFHLRTNQMKQMSGLITYMRHIFESNNSGPDLQDDPFHPFTPDE